VFGQDGCLAFVVWQEERAWVSVDGQDARAYEDVLGLPVFSPDGRRLAYRAMRDGEEMVVCDGQEGKGYARVGEGSLVFSPDGRHLAYLAGVGRGQAGYVIDGQEGPVHAFVLKGSFRFSPDSRRSAYVTREGEAFHWLLDGARQAGWDGLSAAPSGFVFSPNSRRTAYVGFRDRRPWLVMDGGEAGPFEVIDTASPVFSPDSRHLAACVQQDGKWRLWVDGQLAEAVYDDLVGPLVFSGTDRFHALQLRQGEVVRVEALIEG
jgi:hypothetical protein